ncbi:MAG TPA: hypothetical protein VD789_00855 [Thermomicrobiales bacterium]|nr:hypothetical protein [Thermomicrobiales bacterium]
MTQRTIRNTAVLLALLAGMLTLFASPTAAQESTPAVEPPVTVGQTELSWTGDWQYDTVNSSPEQATLTQIDAETASIMLATYGEFAEAPVGADGQPIEGSQAVLDTFTEGFVQGVGAEFVQETAAGELEDGTAWKRFDFELQGIQLTLLVTVAASEDGGHVVSMLIGLPDQFGESLASAQEEILLDGEPTFLEGIEPEDVGAAPASPEATPGGV